MKKALFRKHALNIILIFITATLVFFLTKTYFSSSSKNIIDDNKIVWTKDWETHSTKYSGSELVFAVTKTHKISLRASVPSPEPIQDIEITIEGKTYTLSSPNLNKKEFTIYLDKNSYTIPQDIKIQVFCAHDSIPCNLKIEKIEVDSNSKIYKSIIMPQKTLAVLGDSISTNFGSQNYTKLLSDKLNAQLHNSSIMGSTLTNANGKSAMSRYNNDIIKYNPDNVLIFIGINDAIKGKSVDEFIVDYKKIVEEIKGKTKAKIFLAGLLPSNLVNQNTILNYNNTISSLAQSKNVKYIDTYSLLTSEDFEDGLHPNLLSQQKLANLFFQEIKR